MTNELSPNENEQLVDQSLETKLWRLSMIISAARRIHSSLALGSVIDTFLDIATGELGANGGRVYLHEAEGESLEAKHSQWSGGADRPDRLECSRLAEKAMVLGETIEEGSEEGSATIVTLPLRDELNENLGVLQIYRDRDTVLDGGERLFLKELSHFASLSIKNAQYHEDSLDKAQLESALGVAREIQVGTLPKEMPQISGYDVAGLSRPADETSGDSYDLISTEPESLTVLLADAVGHGIGPALSVTQVRSMLRVATRMGVALGDTMQNINDQLCEDLAANRFVTAFLGQLDSNTHRMSYQSAGQGPLILFRAASEQFETFPSTLPPLGIVPMSSGSELLSFEFRPGDTLALISDGVFEAENEDGIELGEAAVTKMLSEVRNVPCSEAAKAILGRVDEYRGDLPQADDITIVLVRRKGQAPRGNE